MLLTYLTEYKHFNSTSTMDIKTLAIKYKLLQDEYKTKEQELKELGNRWAECEIELINLMTEEGVGSLDLDDIGKFSIRTTNYLSVNAQNKEKFYEYLKESGNGSLLKLDVNPRTLTAFLKEHLETVAKSYGEDFEAKNKALAFLNEKGASYFQKREVQFRKGKANE